MSTKNAGDVATCPDCRAHLDPVRPHTCPVKHPKGEIRVYPENLRVEEPPPVRVDHAAAELDGVVVCGRCGRLRQHGMPHECSTQRFIPIDEIPLHDRPDPDELLMAAEILRGDALLDFVSAWLERVARIPEAE